MFLGAVFEPRLGRLRRVEGCGRLCRAPSRSFRPLPAHQQALLCLLGPEIRLQRVPPTMCAALWVPLALTLPRTLRPLGTSVTSHRMSSPSRDPAGRTEQQGMMTRTPMTEHFSKDQEEASDPRGRLQRREVTCF